MNEDTPKYSDAITEFRRERQRVSDESEEAPKTADEDVSPAERMTRNPCGMMVPPPQPPEEESK